MHTESVDYSSGDVNLTGYLAYDDRIKGPRPAVIIAHDWKGLGEFSKDKAEQLAKYGYLALAADVYGDGVVAASAEQAAMLMKPLFENRKLLRERIVAAYKYLKAHSLCNQDRMAAIGFCFGGLTIIELFRCGLHLRGIVSFHGIYGNQVGEMIAKTEPNSKTLHGSVLVLQGYEDPFLPSEDVAKFQKELNDAGVDWQMHIFGRTAHSFTNPLAKDFENGMYFQPASSRRAWQMMHLFLEEIFV